MMFAFKEDKFLTFFFLGGRSSIKWRGATSGSKVLASPPLANTRSRAFPPAKESNSGQLGLFTEVLLFLLYSLSFFGSLIRFTSSNQRACHYTMESMINRWRQLAVFVLSSFIIFIRASLSLGISLKQSTMLIHAFFK